MPAARTWSNAARARAAPCCRPSRSSSRSCSDCTPRLIRFTPASRKPRMRASETVSGLVSRVTSASGASRKASLAGIHQARDLPGLEQRRRAAAEEDRVGRAPIAGSEDLRLESPDVRRLEIGVEQPPVEVAVVADVAAERDVEVEADGGRTEVRPCVCSGFRIPLSGIRTGHDPALPPVHFRSARSRGSRTWARTGPLLLAGSLPGRLSVFQSASNSSAPELDGAWR